MFANTILVICTLALYSISMTIIMVSMPKKARHVGPTKAFIGLSMATLFVMLWCILMPERHSTIMNIIKYILYLLVFIKCTLMHVWRRALKYIAWQLDKPICHKAINEWLIWAFRGFMVFITMTLCGSVYLSIDTAIIEARIEERHTSSTQQQVDEVKHIAVASSYQIDDGNVVSTNHVKKVVDKHSDLAADRKITEDQMNALIRHWCRYKSNSKMLDTGAAFVKASERTGLDPVFLMAIAGHESAWGSSKLHTDKNNPYSICMYDYNVHAGLNMGDSFSEGIITGAEWIRKNYYSEGQTSLYSMIYGPKCYAQAKDHWINSIQQIMNRSYDLLDNM